MKNNITKICTVLLGLTMVACLDDDKYAVDPSGTSNVIEFMDPSVPNSPAGAIYPAWDEAFAYDETVQFERTISFSGPNSNNHDIEVTIDVDPVALDDYNQQMIDDLHGATYELMPANYYEIAATTLTIEKGETTATISITLFPPQFDLSKKFALPLRITSSTHGILSTQYSVAIFGLAIKNKYDANYKATITMSGWSANGISENMPGLYPNVIGLVTTGPNTNLMYNAYWGDYLQPGFTANNAAATAFGNASPIFVFDEATDKLIDVDNRLKPNSAGRDFYINAAPPLGHNQFYEEAEEVDGEEHSARSLIADYYFIATGRPDNHVIMEMIFNGER